MYIPIPIESLIGLAADACRIAVCLREEALEISYKVDGSVVTNADTQVEQYIRDSLRKSGYKFRFRGEELQSENHLEGVAELIVDGIDGTRNFRDSNYGWGTSIAVMVDGEVICGIVCDGVTGETFWAVRGEGGFVRSSAGGPDRRLGSGDLLPPDFSFSVASFRVEGSSRMKFELIEEIKRIGGRQREWGSISLSICAVARGGLGLFVQGRPKIHDVAAAVLVARESGSDITEISDSRCGMRSLVVTHPALRVIQTSFEEAIPFRFELK